MEFLVMSVRRSDAFTPDEFAAAGPAGGARVRELHGQGVIRRIWHRADSIGACFLLESSDAEAAAAAVASLPMARDGMSDFTVVALVLYRGFSAG
ncbi:muconolactone Delta-isomerase family protein [Nakamurella sp. A5-74]|uniref:Muconolactone Delta-isomerase family protein n=1 Tax=Nakamurella sp. A5-74 TaxID=3158264 RepID=A0AAU8DWR5_9ACTN